MEESKKYRLNWEDIKKILKGAGIAMGGAGITYFIAILPEVEMGQYTPFIAGGIMILLNLARKLLSGEK